jgi:hypothetical protein
MPLTIKDNTGKGYGLKVDSKNRMSTKTMSLSQQYVISNEEERAFQLVSEKAIAASEIKLLLLKNTSDTRDLVVSYIRLETIGAAAANVNAYWTIYTGGDYASGGTATTPINMNVGSAIAAEGIFYDATASSIVTSGTQNVIDKTWEANTQIVYNQEGSLILPKNACLTISWTGSTAAGTARTRVSFYYNDES